MSFLVADVVVVGGGIVGTLIARTLGQRGLRVSLLDAGVIGGEASYAAAGMLAPGGEHERAGLGLTLSIDSSKLWGPLADELRAETGIEPEYRKSGAVELAVTDNEAEALYRKAMAQSGLGIPSEAITAKEVHWLVPKLGHENFSAARYYLEDAMVDPRMAVAALKQSCLMHRVDVVEGRPAQYIQPEFEVTQVMTAEGLYVAKAVVLAAGAWSNQVQVSQTGGGGGGASEVFPVKGHLVSYEMTPGTLLPILRHRDTYLLQRRSGALIAGSTMERRGFDRVVDEMQVREIHSRAARLFPALQSKHPREAWIGFRPATPNGEPVLAKSNAGNLWMAYGHFRNGVLQAPATAQMICHDLLTTLERS